MYRQAKISFKRIEVLNYSLTCVYYFILKIFSGVGIVELEVSRLNVFDYLVIVLLVVD